MRKMVSDVRSKLASVELLCNQSLAINLCGYIWIRVTVDGERQHEGH